MCGTTGIIILYYIILYSIILYYITIYCITLVSHYIILQWWWWYITIYDTILYSMMSRGWPNLPRKRHLWWTCGPCHWLSGRDCSGCTTTVTSVFIRQTEPRIVWLYPIFVEIIPSNCSRFMSPLSLIFWNSPPRIVYIQWLSSNDAIARPEFANNDNQKWQIVYSEYYPAPILAYNPT